MAGMFYSLQEVAEKLNKTEDEVKEIVKAGRLREFRDGPNLLFKVDEVEALLSDTSIMAPKDTSAPSEQPASEDEISLAPETDQGSAAGSDLTDADTAITAEGVNVLGDTDTDYKLTDDTMAETKAASAEASSLEEIEEDVSLDSFGSGSGLLDLSLQADDTSLGGILDEIYTPEAGEEGQAVAEAPEMEVPPETEQMLEEQELVTPEPSLVVPAAVQAYVETAPDTVTNALGIMLFLPLLAVIYTAIIVVAALNNVMPSILKATQGMIWYILGGFVVAAGLIPAGAFMLAGKGGTTAKKPKAKKAKKEKKPKAKKEKKPKKEKKAKS